MISIADQLKGLGAAMPARKEKAVIRHGMLGHEIDALVLEEVVAHPGSLAEFIHDAVEHHGLTDLSVSQSLRRLVVAGKVVEAQRRHTEKKRYWPPSHAQEAREWSLSFDQRVKEFLDKHGEASTKDVADFLGYNQSSTRRALHRMPGVESYEVKAGKGRKLMWRAVK